MTQEEIEKAIIEIKEGVNELGVFLRKSDIRTNADIQKALGLKSKKTLLNWSEQGCPRESSTHASLSAVMKWRRESVTKAKK
jgi:hypothetical protein